MGTVDVERYTGSCLISTAVRGKPKPKGCSDIHDNVTRIVRMNEEASNPQGRINDPRNLAGAPLVSMAASIRRGGSKPKYNNPNRSKDPTVWRPVTMIVPQPPAVYFRNADSPSYNPRNPHSLQGAPLIRLPRMGKASGLKSSPRVEMQTLPPRFESIDGSSGSVSSDCSSVTSDEGVVSGGSDSSLPRLIKPRKRRKKERKIAFNHQTEKRGDETCASPESDSDLLANEAIARFLQLNLDSSPDTETSPPSHLIGFGDSYRAEEMRRQQWGVPSFPSGGWNSVWGNSTSLPTWSDPLVPTPSTTDPWWPESCADKKIADSGCFGAGSPKADLLGGSLEVSSEIITSPYGHRDIEIRFFSSVRNSASPDEGK